MRYLPLALAIGFTPIASEACTLSFTSPGDGATVRSPGITVYGQGGASATEGDFGTVTATLNGSSFFNYSGSFTAAVSFLEGRGVGVTLRPGLNFLFVRGSVGGCSASDTMTISYEPELIQSKNNGAPPPESCQGNPINVAVGNKYQAEVDYVSAVSPNLSFARFYNSFNGYWRHTYSHRLVLTANSIRLIQVDGRERLFSLSGTTTTPEADERGKLELVGDRWIYSSDLQEIYQFDSQGRLVEIRSPNARSVSLVYSANNVTVTSDVGEQLTFTQDIKYQPLTLSAQGLEVEYSYDGDWRLLGVQKNQAGSITNRSFLYENQMYPRFLTGIIDENGERYATWAYDGSGRAISSSHADGADHTSVAYNADGSTSVTNSLGKVTNYQYQIVNGVKKVVAIEGEPSPNCASSNSTFTYDDRGLLKTKTDNKGIVTTYDYNDRGLEVTRVEASDTAQARTVTTEWHPSLYLPVAVTEPDRITRYQYDAQGRQLSRTVENR